MTPIEILKAIKEDIRVKFEADPLMMRTINLVITEFEARTERLHKHNVSGSPCRHLITYVDEDNFQRCQTCDDIVD